MCWKRKIEGDIGIHDIEDSQHKANKSKKYHSIITEEHLKLLKESDLRQQQFSKRLFEVHREQKKLVRGTDKIHFRDLDN